MDIALPIAKRTITPEKKCDQPAKYTITLIIKQAKQSKISLLLDFFWFFTLVSY